MPRKLAVLQIDYLPRDAEPGSEPVRTHVARAGHSVTAAEEDAERAFRGLMKGRVIRVVCVATYPLDYVPT